jgi:hypothetical protein
MVILFVLEEEFFFIVRSLQFFMETFIIVATFIKMKNDTPLIPVIS